MSTRDALTLGGLVLTVAGALLLALGDKFPGTITWGRAQDGMPNRFGWRGFALIAAGTVVQAIALAFHGE